MGTYPPRECGIATFNQDLLNSSQEFFGARASCKVAALNFSLVDAYIYPPEVKWEVDQNSRKEHLALAEQFNNDDNIIGIIIQHEYGIYGGKDGKNILLFMENCKKPMVVTLHTVLPAPSRHMREVTEKIIRCANAIVVLTQNSKKVLMEVYPGSVNKVHVIPHGIHPTAFEGMENAKRKLELEKKTVLSTFGLLSRGKGIEYVINALPKLVKAHPSILYLVLGETHPVVRRAEGESYRKELSRLVIKLRLKKYVKFYDQYLSLKDLIGFLKATDIYISTSINPNQAVSGTLSYALGTGRAVVSTEFAQAKEIITPDSGRLVPIRNPEAYTNALLELLSDKHKLKKMHKTAYDITRPMLWGNVAKEYSKLLKRNILPPINLAHLARMTDEFGLFQFAKLNIPDKKFGYTLDDNARALVICSWLNTLKNKKLRLLASTYLNFIKRCQLPDGTFVNYVEHSHKTATAQNKEEDLEDTTARAMWALGEVMASKFADKTFRSRAEKMFLLTMPTALKLRHIRSAALVIKSFAKVAEKYPKYRRKLLKAIKNNADFLVGELNRNTVKSWHWFDTYLGYNNGIIPEALFLAGQITNNKNYIVCGKKALEFLIKETFVATKYMPIGHSQWYQKNQKRSYFDQQPEDPASMILALATAFEITHDEKHRKLIDICFSWFLGNNSLGLPLYNCETGGCYDGLHPDRVNLNQGAESLISYLLARLTVGKLTKHENSKNKTYLL